MTHPLSKKMVNGFEITLLRCIAAFLIFYNLCACSNVGRPSHDLHEDSKLSLKLQVRFHTSAPVFGSSALYFADQIKQWTESMNVKIYEPGELVPINDLLLSVDEGRIDAGWIPLSLLENKIEGALLFDGPPFSPSAKEHYRWLTLGSGGGRLQKALLDAGYSAKVIPASMSGPEGFGWFSKPIRNPNDIKGLELRYTYYGSKVMNRLGATTSPIPADDIYPAFEKKDINGFEYSTPYIDKGRRFHQLAKFYYYPSSLQPFHTIVLLINRDTWNQMTPTQHQIIQNVCNSAINWSLHQDKLLADRALEFFKTQGTTVSPVPSEIVSAAKKEWQEYAEALGNVDSDFKANYQSYLAFIEKKEARYNTNNPVVQYELVPIDKEYEALIKADIRNAPNIGSQKVGQLTEGEKVIAIGRVKGENWIYISRNGKKLGYVHQGMIGSAEDIRGFVAPGSPSSQAVSIPTDLPVPGNFYALIIGIENYRYLPPLFTPFEDAKGISRLLEEKYGFMVDQPLLLDATREEILDKFGVFREKMTKNDNLLIYYAGHGTIDRTTGRGYWQPVDADPRNPANWISNEDVTNSLMAMHARHVIVIADSCYSGTITRSLEMNQYKDGGEREWIRRMIGRKSRTALTSGGTEPVSDSGGGENSVFAKYLLQVLRNNDQVIDMDSLFQPIREGVVWNAQQTPKYEIIRFAGHDGGDFIFFPR